jgi:hypothetical protein
MARLGHPDGEMNLTKGAGTEGESSISPLSIGPLLCDSWLTALSRPPLYRSFFSSLRHHPSHLRQRFLQSRRDHRRQGLSLPAALLPALHQLGPFKE